MTSVNRNISNCKGAVGCIIKYGEFTQIQNELAQNKALILEFQKQIEELMKNQM